MPFTVQLDLDARTQTALAALAVGIERISGLETMRYIGDVHHLSLAVYEELPVGLVLPKLRSFADSLRPLALRIANIGIFPGGVLFLGVVVTPELLALHRRYHDELAAFAGSCAAHYRPGAFVPHITLALNAEGAALDRAVPIIRDQWRPSDAELDALRLIEFRPVRTLFLQPL
jgi:2'-5' RNA ligase